MKLRHIVNVALHDRGNWAFALTIAAGYVSVLLAGPGRFSPAALALLAGAGVVYVVAGVFVFAWISWQPTPLNLALYFGFQALWSSLIIYWGQAVGFLSIIIMPLASHAAMLLPRRWMIAACALVLACYALVIGLLSDSLASSLTAAISMVAGTLFVVVFTQVALNERRARDEVERLAVELSGANQKLREYAAQVEELATARERNRLAREIHDSLGHYLTVINVQLEAARAVSGSDPSRAADALSKAQSLAREGLADVRRSVAALRASPMESRPLPEAVSALAEECRAAGIRTDFSVNGEPRPLAPQAELTLYRAAQEGLTNIRKHAHASHAEVSLDYIDADCVRLTVKDNGVGSLAAGHNADGGFGLIGVRERAQLLGGQVRIQTEMGQGFALEVELPDSFLIARESVDEDSAKIDPDQTNCCP